MQRWRESGSGSVTEHANLASDGKRKGARSQAEAESSDALERGGLTRMSDEDPVNGVGAKGLGTEVRNMVNWETRHELWKSRETGRFH